MGPNETLLAALAALLSTEPAPDMFPALQAGGADPRYPVEIAPCTRPVAPREIDGQTVICGTVAVPEDHDDPGERKLNLSFIVYRSHSLVPVDDPVVYLHGGPGGGTVQEVNSVSVFFDHLRGRRDVIAFDQRGVDASAPDMDCFRTLALNAVSIVDSIQGVDVPNIEQTVAEGCIQELEERGFDLPLFNTTQNAQDVTAVMSALGYPTYNIYGVSYGTKLALEVLRSSPEGVRSVIIDSVAPPQIALYDTLYVPHAEAITNTFAPCEANAECTEAYPDITQRYWDLLEHLQETPLDVDGETLDGVALFALFSGRNNWANADIRDFTMYAPALVSQLEEGDLTLIRQIFDGVIPAHLSGDLLVAGAAGLSPDEQVLAQTVANAMNQVDLAFETAASAIVRLEADLDADAAPADLAEYFDDELEKAAGNLPERQDRVAFARDYLNLRFVDPNPGDLIQLVREHFEQGTAARLATLVALLDLKETDRVFELIGVDNQALEQVAEGNFELFLYACQEDFVDGFNSLEGYESVMDGLAIGPLVRESLAETMNTFYPICRLFEPQPRPDWLEPVSSDLPTMVFSGEIDTQTASSWGPLVAETLSNSQAIVFPEAGHGSLLFSQCARDIGEAFLEAPGDEISTDCVADLRLPYLMPDGSLLSVSD